MRAKFKVLSGERLCEKAFGVNLGEFNGSKSVLVSDKGYKNTLANEVKSLKNALKNEVKNSKSAFVSDKSYKSTLASEFKNSKNAFVGEFDSYENAVASQKGALMSAFKTHLSELKRAFASLCERTKFKNERVKKNFGVGISLSLSLSLVLAPCALSALELDIQGQKHWIWTGDKKSAEDGIKQTLNGKPPTQAKEDKGVIKFTNEAGEGANYFLIGQGQHIDKITLGSSSTLSAFSFNGGFSVGEMIIKNGSFSHIGRWATADTCGTKGTCSAINVDKLVLDNSAGTTGATFSLGAINAKTTEVKGKDATTEISITTTGNKGSYKVGLGDISVGNGKLKLGGDESIYENFNLTLQANGKIDTTSNTIIKDKLQTLTLEARDGVSYDLAGLTFGQQTTIQVATIATSDADYFATKDKATMNKITGSTKEPQRYKSERRVIDNGVSKHSGDEVTITAKDTTATDTYIANTTMTNYKVGLSDSLQAVLDAGFLARQILIADTMAINSKMMNYKNSQFATLYRSNTRGDALAMRGDERVGDVWVDYDYSNLKDLGESNGNSLDIKSSAVQVGGGVVNSGSTKAAFFVRYTSANAKSTQIQNTYKASAINAGLFVAQSLWANGYLRGHFSFHNIGVKSDYTLQNTRTGDTSGSFKNGFNYLTTGIGVEQEANFTPALWANLAFDFNHLVALGKANNFVLDDEEEVPSAGADSLTMATFGATLGGKLSYNVILYARAQIGFALANYLDEIEVKAKLDGAGGGGGAGPGGVPGGGGGAVGPAAPTIEHFSWSHYDFNGIVGDFGLGLAWQASRKLQVSLEGANLIYGGASSSFNTKLGVDFRF